MQPLQLSKDYIIQMINLITRPIITDKYHEKLLEKEQKVKPKESRDELSQDF